MSYLSRVKAQRAVTWADVIDRHRMAIERITPLYCEFKSGRITIGQQKLLDTINRPFECDGNPQRAIELIEKWERMWLEFLAGSVFKIRKE